MLRAIFPSLGRLDQALLLFSPWRCFTSLLSLVAIFLHQIYFKYNWPALHWVFPVRFHLYDGSSIFLAVPDLAQLPWGLHQLSSHSADWRIDRCNFISFFLHCPNLFWKLLETTLKFTESRFIPVFLIVLLLKTWLKIVCLGICKLGWNKRSLFVSFVFLFWMLMTSVVLFPLYAWSLTWFACILKKENNKTSWGSRKNIWHLGHTN